MPEEPTKRPGSTDEPSSPTVTGRTPYDSLVEIVRDVLVVLGHAAPYVVIAALVVFGAFKFIELETSKLDEVQRVRVDTLAENAETIRTLKDQILKDAGAITSLQSSNVDVIVKQITAQQKIAAIITDSTARIAELTEQSVRFNADVAAKEAQQQALADKIAADAARIEEGAARIKEIEARAQVLERTAQVATHLIKVLSDSRTFVPTCNLWQIAERYEGGTADHVGQDYAGQFYYGIFRIRGGTEMVAFIDYLHKRDPFTARALGSAYDAGATTGAFAFVSQWRNLAQRPEFGGLQRDYISDNDYAATKKKCRFKGHLKLSDQSVAFQSAMWAATVQHGPSRAGGFCVVLKDVAPTLDDRALVERLYALRDEALATDFAEQDPLIHRLLRLRYELEKKDAYQILAAIDRCP